MVISGSIDHGRCLMLGQRQQRSYHRRAGIGRSVIGFRCECFESTEVLDAWTGAGEIFTLR